jgi:hypothetical protein
LGFCIDINSVGLCDDLGDQQQTTKNKASVLRDEQHDAILEISDDERSAVLCMNQTTLSSNDEVTTPHNHKSSTCDTAGLQFLAYDCSDVPCFSHHIAFQED